MKQKLQRGTEWLELFLNYAVVFCMEIAVNALVGDRVPVGVWLVAALYPVCFYVFRAKLKHFWSFFLLHPAVVVLATLAVKSWLAGAIGIAVLGVFYSLHSISLRVHHVIQEREFPLPAAAAVMIVAFFVCSYKQSQTGCMLVLGSFFVWLPGILLKRYAENYLSYVKLNAGSAGVIPEKNIFRTGIIVVVLYTVGCVALLIVCSATPLVDKLTESAAWLGKTLLWVLAWLLVKLSGNTQEAEKPMETESTQEMGMDWGELGDTRAMPVWIEVIEQVIIWAVVAALIVAVIIGIVFLFRWMVKNFYQAGRGHEEILEAGVEEKTESIAYTEKRKRTPFFIGTEPAAKIRRAYKKTIDGAFGRRSRRKGKETEEPVLLYPASSMTAQELTQWACDAGGVRENATEQQTPGGAAASDSGIAQGYGVAGAHSASDSDTARDMEKRADWAQLTALYEQARYGSTEPEREQARAAVKLSGKILHMIKKK